MSEAIRQKIQNLWDEDRTRDMAEFAYDLTDHRSDLRLHANAHINYQHVMDVIRLRRPEAND